MNKVIENKYGFDMDKLFVVGKRDNNPKRNFLFISKLLGKHLSVNPDVVKATGFMLSSLKYGFDNKEYVDCINNGTIPTYRNAAKDNVLVIGFCETATGLGLSVASSIVGSTYQTTTRTKVNDNKLKKLLTFEEEHSHATTHNMFSDFVNLSDYSKVILVDDEITTGNSLLNLMKRIKENADVKEFNIMTILDWRNAEQIHNFTIFENENNVKINVYALVRGVIGESDNTVYHNETLPEINGAEIPLQLKAFPRNPIKMEDGTIKDLLANTGKFGMEYIDIARIENYAKAAARQIKATLPTEKTLLVLGHGENMFIPSRVAANLQYLGYDVKFRTTSLSPIYCDGEIIKEASTFVEANNKYHFYNKSESDNFDKVIMLIDNENIPKLTNNFISYIL